LTKNYNHTSSQPQKHSTVIDESHSNQCYSESESVTARCRQKLSSRMHMWIKRRHIG